MFWFAAGREWLCFRTGGQGDLPEEVLKRLPELSPHEAVQQWVEAAVGVRETHGHREHVNLRGVVLVTEVRGVQLNQDAPSGQCLVGQPAQEEAQHHDGHRFGHFGPPSGPGRVGAPVRDEAQQ